jgi:thiopeptide-type bacteriocin biosynthesis protein
MDILRNGTGGEPAQRLQLAERSLSELAQKPISHLGPANIKETVSHLRDAVDCPDREVNLQLDAGRILVGSLPAVAVTSALELAACYARCSEWQRMTAWRERVIQRYEGRTARIDLLELIHPDFGVPAPLPFYEIDSPYSDAVKQAHNDFLHEAWLNGSAAVQVTTDELETLLPPLPKPEELPDSFDLAFIVSAASPSAIHNGDFCLFPGLMHPTSEAGRSTGRFAPVLASAPQEYFQRRWDERSDDRQVYAELVYAPARASEGNVSQRPLSCKYAIIVGDERPIAGHDVIPLGDLYISVETGAFTLHARSLDNRRVILREFHMLNYNRAPTIVRFLAHLNRDSTRTIRPFAWQSGNDYFFTPRLSCGRLILTRATWRLPRKIVTSSKLELKEQLKRYRVPDLVFLSTGDNKLFLDLSTNLGVELMMHHARKIRDSVVRLEESPDVYTEAVWDHRDRPFYAEHVLSVFQSPNADELPEPIQKENTKPTIPLSQRDYHIGSEWISAKLFCGKSDADDLLSGYVSALIANLNAQRSLRRWFFLRYSDSGRFHIRLRLNAAPNRSEFVMHELTSFARELLATDVLRDYELCTYRREVERYGGFAAIDLIEDVFWQDSILALNLLRSNLTDEERLVESLISFDTLCRGLVGTDACIHVASRIAGRAKLPATLRGPLRDAIASVTANRKNLPGDFDAIGLRLRSLEAENIVAPPLQEIIPSVYHMHQNRFGADPSADEIGATFYKKILMGLPFVGIRVPEQIAELA